MKSSLSLTFLALLLACGQPRIESVDDKVLEQANADKAAASLKQAQIALLGTWRSSCVETAESTASLYEYALTQDGQASLVSFEYGTRDCKGETVQSTFLSASWTLIPVADTESFTLEFKWKDGKKLDSQYRLAGNSAEFPRLFELRDQSDLALVELKEKDHFLTLEKVPAGEAEELRKKSELLVMEYATSLLKRPGTWESACADGKRSILTFKVGNTITLSHTSALYDDKDCKTLKGDESRISEKKFTMAAVPDLAQKKIVLDADGNQGTLKVSFDRIDQLELSDLINGKNTLTLYRYAASAGVTP
ncbi:hypothetical protein [Oligoflexus tunisiensis]|uniref:hypothetical protein n=1 Tax=Oligoflexus tunisiensis TaxID=708132 RepID=UPI00114CA06C|nr:hypothetical protein [Oligoflexus tunisiensis]